MGNPNWTKGCPSPNPNGRPSAAIEDRLKLIRDGIKPHVPAIIDAMAEKASKGCPQSAKLVMQYFLPPSQLSETRLQGAADLAKYPPDQRISMINERVATGLLSLEKSEVLIRMATAEIEAQVVDQVRQLVKQLRRGDDVAIVVEKLREIDITPIVEPASLPLLEMLK